MRRLLVPILAMLPAVAALGHDFWLDAGSLRPEGPGPVAIWVRGGHYFPNSAIALADRLIASLTVETPGGESSELQSETTGSERRGTFTPAASQLYRLSLVIQQPRQPAPIAWAHLFIVPAGAATDPAGYAASSGLEIVPRTKLESFAANSPIGFAVLRDGKPLSARIEFVAASGGGGWATAGPDQPAEFTPRGSGRHLARAREDGQTATLVFEVAP